MYFERALVRKNHSLWQFLLLQATGPPELLPITLPQRKTQQAAGWQTPAEKRWASSRGWCERSPFLSRFRLFNFVVEVMTMTPQAALTQPLLP